MKHRRLSCLSFLCLLIANLLCGQHVALAHMVGHIGQGYQGVAALAMQDGDSEHGSLESLARVCTTCAALAGFDLPLVAIFHGFGDGSAVREQPFNGSQSRRPTTRFTLFRSRAPPVLPY